MIDFEKYADDLIERFRRNRSLQKKIAFGLLVVLLGLAGKFAFELFPRHYNLSLSGGSLLGNRHHLAKILSEESGSQNLSIRVVPTLGALDALELIDEGKLDMAFIQSGLDTNFQNVTHVATIAPELIHFLVKPDVKSIKDIRGKVVNMGEVSGGTRILAKQILDLSGLEMGVDYVETNHSDLDLIEMRPNRLPDVIVLVSYTPSDVAEFLVKERGYDLIEMPFPPSLAIRLGWVADSKILGYMYSIVPPVPKQDIQVVGVNLHLVANKNIDPRAIAKVIETLYSPRVAARFNHPLIEANMLLTSGYPISAGTELYLSRKAPIITDAMIDKIKAMFGLIMSIGSMGLVLLKWLQIEPEETEKKPEQGDIPLTEAVSEKFQRKRPTRMPQHLRKRTNLNPISWTTWARSRRTSKHSEGTSQVRF
jgi:TRAP-type uncharacterized transport system substrate-binding protein